MNVEKKNFTLYDKLYYNQFEEKSFEVLSKTKVFERIINKNKISFRNKKVLEIGFGSGNLVPLIIKNGGSYCGLEISNSAIINCKKKYGKKIKVDVIQKNEIQYPNQQFDFVLLSHVIEHIKKEDELLIEVVRVLKKNGILIIGVPSLCCLDNQLHFRVYSKKDFLRICKEYSLYIVDYIEFGELPFLNRFLKFFIRNENNKFQVHSKNSDQISLFKIIYYNIISPFISKIYSMGVFSNGVSEIWGVLKNGKKY